MFIGLCALYIANTTGIGAAVFSRLGTRTLKNGVRKTEPPQPAGGALPTSPQALPEPPAAGTAPDAT